MNICNICVSFCNPRDHNASLFYEYPAAGEKGQLCRIDAAIGCILFFHLQRLKVLIRLPLYNVSNFRNMKKSRRQI